ncbi:hypothetical protein VNI00_017752 [Paramarasmius palmivorus]|uniref:CxC2-like cysteine cluster KDZ transposase-associated domain-containing protein n=1 Tax=Paramarasmius palmivorus TaxID=297713 RepID=A0AAW0B364_9AGAR
MGTSKSNKGKGKAPQAPQVQRIRVEKVHRTAAFLKVEALTSDGRRVRQRMVKVSGLSPEKKRVGPISVPTYDSMLMNIDERGDDLVLGGQGLFVNAGEDTEEVEGTDGDFAAERRGKDKLEEDLRWNGSFFERATLKDLGLVVQLGHSDGSSCSLRDMARSGFVVVDVDSIQEVSISYCACRSEEIVGQKWQQLIRHELFPGSVEEPYTAFTFRVLSLFHALTLKGKINLYDFYYGIELRSNGGGCFSVKDRYDVFRRVTRQWRYLKMLKRGGIANDRDRRLEDIRPGELAVRCIACPQPGVNLPEGWQAVASHSRFLYYKFLSLDACFRLKRRSISSEAADPGLLTDQKETNDCSSLAAVKQANTKFNRGYATTGCLLCMCSRHEICEPNGVVDLNRGEKFLLGDYALGASQRLSSAVLKRVLSYDIACQYSKKFFERMRHLPKEACIEMEEKNWSFVVPKLHIRGHERPCQERYALHLHPGAGQTDGEGIERLWAEVGPVGVSTREMGPGHRRDTIDDHQGARNWRKICGLGDTEEDVRLRMAILEAERSIRGEPVLHEVAPSAFMLLGLDIEDQQRRMVISMGEKDAGSAREKTGVVEKRAKLGRLIARFRSLQQIYIPSSLTYLATLPNFSNVDSVEKIPVLLPSGLPESIRTQSIMKEWAEREEEFRCAQLRTSLRGLRRHLFVRAGLDIERSTQARGQKGSTRARQDLARNEGDIQVFKTKYQAAWNALLVLSGEERLRQLMPGYQQLLDNDVRSHEDEDAYCVITSRKSKPSKDSRPLITGGESRRSLSWIWSGVDVTGDSKAMQEALRIEWSKCWARKRRWDEELALIIEEKRRVLESLRHDQKSWLVKAKGNEGAPEGYSAYALRQAALREGLIERFVVLWNTPIRHRIRATRTAGSRENALDGGDIEEPSEEEDDDELRVVMDDEEDEDD